MLASEMPVPISRLRTVCQKSPIKITIPEGSDSSLTAVTALSYTQR